MNDIPTSNPAPAAVCPEPVPYQWSLCEYLKSEERELWNWFSSNRVRTEHAQNVRLELLKSTYRIECETQPELYSRHGLAARFGVASRSRFTKNPLRRWTDAGWRMFPAKCI